MQKKFNIILLSILGIILLFSNVYGYNLEYNAEPAKDRDGFYVYTYVKSSEHARDYFKATGKRVGEDYIRIDIDNWNGYGAYGEKWGSYDIMGIMFQKNPYSNYSLNPSNNPIEWRFAYVNTATGEPFNDVQYKTWSDSNNYNVIYAEHGVVSQTSMGNTYQKYRVTDLSETLDYSHYYSTNSAEFPYPEYTLIQNDTIVKFRYFIPSFVISNLDSEGVIQTDSQGRNYVYISFSTKMAGVGSEPMKTASEFYNRVFNNPYNAISTAYKNWVKYIAQIKSYNERLTDIENKHNSGYYGTEVAYEQEKAGVNKLLNDVTQLKEDIENTYYYIDQKTGEKKCSFSEDADVAFGPYVKGVDYGGYYKSGYSAANDYDNILYLQSSPEIDVQYALYSKEKVITLETPDFGYPFESTDDEELKNKLIDKDSLPITVVREKTTEKEVDREKIEKGTYLYNLNVYERFNIKENIDYVIENTKKIVKYNGKNYLLTMCVDDEEYKNVFSKQEKERIKEKLISKFALTNTMTVEQLYAFLLEKTTPIEDMKLNLGKESIYSNSRLIIRWVYVEIPTDLYVQYQLMTVDSGKYRTDTVNPFSNLIEIKDGIVTQRQFAYVEKGIKDTYTEDDGFAKEVFKVEKITKETEKDGKVDKVEVAEDLLELTYLDPENDGSLNNYKEQIENGVYVRYGINNDEKYRLSAKNKIDGYVTGNNEWVDFYLAEYLSEHLDEIVFDDDIKDMIKKQLYSLGKYPGTDEPDESEFIENGSKYQRNCSRLSLVKNNFKDAYKTLEKVGEEEYSVSIAHKLEEYKKGDSEKVYSILKVDDVKKYKYKELDKTEEDEEGTTWYDIYPDKYNSGDVQVLRLVYIEVPKRSAGLYVQYQLMTLSGGTLYKDNVDMYLDTIEAKNSKRVFKLNDKNTADKLVRVNKLTGEIKENLESSSIIYANWKITDTIKGNHLTNARLYGTQIASDIYQGFELDIGGINLYKVQAQNTFEATIPGSTNKPVKFYLIDYLISNKNNLRGIIDPNGTMGDNAYDLIANLLDDYISGQESEKFNYSRFAYATSLKQAISGLGNSVNFLEKKIDNEASVLTNKTTYSYAISLNKNLKPSTIDEDYYDLTTQTITGMTSDGKVPINQTLRLVYLLIPEAGESKQTIELKGLNLVGKLQFISLNNGNDTSVLENQSLISIMASTNNKSIADFKKNYDFFNSTYKEDNSNDFIPTDEYISPYATDAYSYIIRAMGWKVHEDDKQFTKKVVVQRGYEYSYRWFYQDAQLPNYISSTGNPMYMKNKFDVISYVEENKDLFYYYHPSSSGNYKVTSSTTSNSNSSKYLDYITENGGINSLSSKLKTIINNELKTDINKSIYSRIMDNIIADYKDDDSVVDNIYKQIIYNYAVNSNILELPDNNSYILNYFKPETVNNVYSIEVVYNGPQPIPGTNYFSPGGYVLQETEKGSVTTNKWNGLYNYAGYTQEKIASWKNYGYFNNYFKADYSYNGINHYSPIDNNKNYGTVTNNKSISYNLKNNSYIYRLLTFAVKSLFNENGDDEELVIDENPYNNSHDYFLKYWYYDTSVCPYAESRAMAYGDHIHDTTCCQGYNIDKEKSEYSYLESFTCNNVIKYICEITITNKNEEGEIVTATDTKYTVNASDYFTREQFLQEIQSVEDNVEIDYRNKNTTDSTKYPYYSISEKEEKCSQVFTMYKGDYEIKTGSTVIKSEYNSSMPIYHSTTEVQNGKCAENTNLPGEVVSSSVLPSNFDHTMGGSIRLTEDKTCPKCMSIYEEGRQYACIFEKVNNLVTYETSNKDHCTVQNCQNSYPYLKIASCTSPFAWDGEKGCNLEPHPYGGVEKHDDDKCRCFIGHIHSADCFKTSYIQSPASFAKSDTFIDSNEKKKILKISTIADTKNSTYYSYWISPNGKSGAERAYFTDKGVNKALLSVNAGKEVVYEESFNYGMYECTGIYHSDSKFNENTVKSSLRLYTGELESKFYTINNFQMYKIASVTLYDNDTDRTYKETTNNQEVVKSLNGNATFKFYQNLKGENNNKIIEPSEEYKKLFTNSNNTIVSPSRIVKEPYFGSNRENSLLYYNGKTASNSNMSSSITIIDLDRYADNIQNENDYEKNEYSSEYFESEGRNYYVTNYKEYSVDGSKFKLGSSLDYDLNTGALKSYNGSVLNSNSLLAIETSSKGKYSMGDYHVDAIRVGVPVSYKSNEINQSEPIYHYITTTKDSIIKFINSDKYKEKGYTLKYVNSTEYLLIFSDNDNYNKDNIKNVKCCKKSEFEQIKTLFSNTTGNTSNYVSTPGRYTGAAGRINDFVDAFATGREYDSSNMFLADQEFYERWSINGSSNQFGVGKLFEKKVQDSVNAMSNTEAMLRIGVTYEINDFYNDYFKFTKNYGETLQDDTSLNHHANYSIDGDDTNTSLLNRNKYWGNVKYVYDSKYGLRVYTSQNYASDGKTPLYNEKQYEKVDSSGNITYTNIVYDADTLKSNFAFEDYLEYTLQGRNKGKSVNISETAPNFKEKNVCYLIKTAITSIMNGDNYTTKLYSNPNSELNKLFDLTDFLNSVTVTGNTVTQMLGKAIREANGNNINKISDTYTVKGILGDNGGTYYKTENPKSTKSSEYVYTKNYEKFTDTKDNDKKIDIYDWLLSSYKTLSKLQENVTVSGNNTTILEGQMKGDGTGNGERDFIFEVKYELVTAGKENTNTPNELYRFKKDESEEQNHSNILDDDYSDYTNYTQYGEVTRVNAETVYLSRDNFDGNANYQSTIVNDNVMATTDFNNTGSKLNILNPMHLADVEVKNTDLVSQELSGRDEGTIVLGKNTTFAITFIPGTSTANVEYGKVEGNVAQGINTGKYIKEYWIVNDFDCNCRNCAEHPNGGWHAAGDIIRVASSSNDKKVTFEAVTTGTYGETAVGINKNYTKVYAISTNMPGFDEKGNIGYSLSGSGFRSTKLNKTLLAEYVYNAVKAGETTYQESDESSQNGTESIGITYNGKSTNSMNEKDKITNNPLYQYDVNDAYHVIYRTFETESTYRIFGFEITDFKDLSYKNIFRNGVAATGNYFSGRYQWNYNILGENNEIQKFEGQLGNSNTRIDRTNSVNYKDYGGGYVLPVGPNSIKDEGYTYGPKLGYRFSFDFKTTGYLYSNQISNRKVVITPSYYYISKDGKINKNVELYYKNSDGNYIKFVDSGYKIAFTPNDGYRNFRFTGERGYKSYLSSDMKYIEISSSKGFTLNSNHFMTVSYEDFIQTWYGEFKLPNSTIVVPKQANGSSNPNNALKNGYIGVTFDIKCIDSGYLGGNNLIVSYNENDTGRGESNNTSQWDYDGIFNVDHSGKGGNVTLKDYNWTVSDNEWQTIKSTVVLYETDLRADDDFN